jgi:hypothetical protein
MSRGELLFKQVRKNKASQINKTDRTRDKKVIRENRQIALPERIAKKAYELYEKRGRISGHEKQDWLEAERTIQRK